MTMNEATSNPESNGQQTPEVEPAAAAAVETSPAERVKFAEVPLTKLVEASDARAIPAEPTDELVDSIQAKGILQPLLAIQRDDGTYEIVEGRRRLKALRRLGWKTAPVFIGDPKKLVNTTIDGTPISRDYSLALCAHAANTERQNLSAYDTAMLIKRGIEEGLTQTQIARIMERTGGYVSQYLAIFDLDPQVVDRIRNYPQDHAGTLTKARILKQRVPDKTLQRAMAEDLFGREPKLSIPALRDALDRIEAQERKRGNNASVRAGARAATAARQSFERATFITKASILRNLAVLCESRLVNQQAAKKPNAVKVAYLKGQVDTFRMLSGSRKLPKSVTKDKD